MKKLGIVCLVVTLALSILFDISKGKTNEVVQDNTDIPLVAEEQQEHMRASGGAEGKNSPIEEEQEKEQVTVGNTCEVCDGPGYSYRDLDGDIHYYCVDHYLEALDKEEVPDDIIVTDLPEEHCAYPGCDNDGEFYFEPSNIWLCDMHWGDYNDIDEFD